MTSKPTTVEPITFERLEAMLRRNPFHHWLGLRLVGFGDGCIEIRAAWRDEFLGNPEHRRIHGGIYATLVDIAGDFAIAARVGRAFPTVDMRVDYHRAAGPQDLTAKGRVVRLGGTLATAEAEILSADGVLLASGRGVYYTGFGSG